MPSVPRTSDTGIRERRPPTMGIIAVALILAAIFLAATGTRAAVGALRGQPLQVTPAQVCARFAVGAKARAAAQGTPEILVARVKPCSRVLYRSSAGTWLVVQGIAVVVNTKTKEVGCWNITLAESGQASEATRVTCLGSDLTFGGNWLAHRHPHARNVAGA